MGTIYRLGFRVSKEPYQGFNQEFSRAGGSVMYDVNNNCVNCDQYIYDQHKNTCQYYVKESYLDFIKRIKEGK